MFIFVSLYLSVYLFYYLCENKNDFKHIKVYINLSKLFNFTIYYQSEKRIYSTKFPFKIVEYYIIFKFLKVSQFGFTIDCIFSKRCDNLI